MMKNKIEAVFLLLFYHFSFVCDGQNPNKYSLPQVTPLSPNAASFGKYGDIPVSLSTGTTNVSVPLLSIKLGSYELPISLANHNNGLKIDEIPSFVGLGWNLNVGGVINCEQRGNYDFDPSGVGLFTTGTYKSMDSLKTYFRNEMIGARKYAYWENIIRGYMDTQFDMYHFNFNGHSGSFYFDTNQNIICIPKSNLKITRPYDGAFAITDEGGNTYFFGQPEYNESTPWPNDEYANRVGFSNNASYFLTSIVTSENREINFSYTSYPYSYQRVHDYLIHYPGASGDPNPICPTGQWGTGYTNYNSENYLLTSIGFDGGGVEFQLSEDYRSDLKTIYSGINVPYLKGILFRTRRGDTLHQFTLHYNNVSRLQLTDLIKDSSRRNNEKWHFDYYGDTSFPVFFSHAKDHWGYYNGSYSVKGIPQANYSFIPYWDNPIGIGANRESNFEYSINGVLKKITYPTGGTTSFVYEANKLVFNHYQDLTNLSPFLYVPHPPDDEFLNINTDSQQDNNGTFSITDTEHVSFTASRWDGYGIGGPNVRGEVYLDTLPIGYGTNIIGNSFAGHGWACNASFVCESSGQITLYPGTYYWGVYGNYWGNLWGFTDTGYASLSLSRIRDTIAYQVGGCRINSVISEDSVGNQIKRKYNYSDNSNSVSFRNVPFYVTRTYLYAIDGFSCALCNTEYKISDESVFPLVGNPIEYGKIIEQMDDSAKNGKTEYTYLNTEDLTGDLGGPPYVPPFLASWRTGSLLSKKIFKNDAGNFVLVQSDSLEYDYYNPPESLTKGFNVAYNRFCPDENYGSREINAGAENYITEKFFQKSASQILYDNSNGITTGSSTICASISHTLPTEKITINSTGDTIRERIKYSFDYDTTSAFGNDALGIRNLLLQNVCVPIEKLTTRTIGSAEYVVGGTLMTYKVDTIVPAKIYQLKVAAPILYSSFSKSIIASGSFTKASQYDEVAEFTKYDDNNNVLQEHYANDLYKSYIWDYNDRYPIAQAVNAKASDIAYTSFESTSKGNWIIGTSGGHSPPSTTTDYAMTGKLSYIGGSLRKGGLTMGNYIVTYWSRSGSMTVNGTTGELLDSTNNWALYEHHLSGIDSVSAFAPGIVDEVRLYPERAQMNTYTYDPFIGVTSLCDVNNRIMYYEYDKVGRLVLIRDTDRHILKRICYNYAGQTEDCN